MHTHIQCMGAVCVCFFFAVVTAAAAVKYNKLTHIELILWDACAHVFFLLLNNKSSQMQCKKTIMMTKKKKEFHIHTHTHDYAVLFQFSCRILFTSSTRDPNTIAKVNADFSYMHNYDGVTRAQLMTKNMEEGNKQKKNYKTIKVFFNNQ